MRIEFEIPGLPKMPNRLLGAHWRVRSRQAQAWKRAVWAAISTQMPRAPRKMARITLTRYSSVEPDTDGLRGSFKPILDALVKCGVIEDDKRENIGEPVVRWEKCPPNKGKIHVVVELGDA